ncbi:DUF559 domain-containing protein [Jatrophihabitans fulvus]
MREAIDQLLTGTVATRSTLLTVVTPAQLDDEIRRGHLVRVFHRTYCRPWDADLEETLERAAVASVGPPVALTGVTALRRWRTRATAPLVHAAVPVSRMTRAQPGLVVHRVRAMPETVLLDGVPTARIAPALVAAWPTLPADRRRGHVIDAVRSGRVSTRQLRAEVAVATRLPGRRELVHLIGLLDVGCESELEIWGHLHVFDSPGLRHAKPRHWVTTPRGRFRLDLGYVGERVAVEMDGDASHSSREQRGRDRRRDAALAGVGWLTLRFTHDRLHHDVDGCRQDTLATLATRP